MSTPAQLALDRGSIAWLFAALFATLAPHAGHLPPWLATLAGLVYLAAALLWWRGRRLPSRWLLLPLVIAGSAGVLVEYRTLFGRDAGVALLVLLTTFKLHELRSRRDAVVIVMLGCFLLLTHFFYNQDIPTGAWLLLSCLLLCATLIRLQAGPASPPRATLRQAALLLAQALPLMLALFILFPRVSGPLWGLPRDAHKASSGLSDSMTPGSISELVLSEDLVLRVRFDGPPPPIDQLYWRGPVMEQFDGRTWRPFPGRTPAARIDARSPPLGYETTLEPHNQRWLLALDAPVFLPEGASTSGQLTANLAEPLNQRKRFRLAASLDYRFNVDESETLKRRNLALPPTGNPQARALAASWQGRSAQEIVDAALTLFAGSDFSYTLEPPLLGADPIDEFVFTTRRGFCEHYSSAFVFLMRAAGVPARTIGGYQGGDYNPVDGSLVVRQSEAHAWAEVWLAGRGWVRVDPTFAVAPSRINAGLRAAAGDSDRLPLLLSEHSAWLRDLRYRWDAVNNAWTQYVLSYTPQRQRDFLARLGLPDADWRQLATLMGAACAVVLLALLAWSMHRQPVSDPALRLWNKALRRLARRRVHCAPGETPLALLARLRQERPELAVAVAAVVEAYLPARYGDRPNCLPALREAVARLP